MPGDFKPPNLNNPDVVSRLGVNLDTTSEVNAKGSPGFDEIVAFSEKIINQNFESLWKQNFEEDIYRVFYDDPSSGTVDLTLDAPRLIIEGEYFDLASQQMMRYSSKEVLYQINIKEGNVQDALKTFSDDLSGWSLAIPTSLNEVEVKQPAPDAKGVTHVEAGSRVYAVAGDYSISRLFAQLTSAKWSQPSMAYSKIIDNNSPNKESMTLDVYDKKYPGRWNAIRDKLSDWAAEEEKAGRTTLNVTFKDPKARDNITVVRPSHAPTWLFQQTYPYISPQKGVEKSRTKLDGTGLNCLLWCEMVGGHPPPQITSLPHTGNFTTAAISNTESPINGTFALSYRHFLEGYLLPILQPINQAINVTVRSISWTVETDGACSFSWNYEIGHDDQHPLSTDEFFQFNRKSSTVGDKRKVWYEWTQTNKDPKAVTTGYTYDYGNGYRQVLDIHEATSTVKFDWAPGSNEFKVSGTTIYHYKDKLIRKKSDGTDYWDETSRLMYKYTCTWEFLIVMVKIVNGVIGFEIREQTVNGARASLKVDSQTDEWNMITPEGQYEKIKRTFQNNITEALVDLERNLNKSLNGSKNFVYPGNGELEYSNAMVGIEGNILAEINFKPLPPGKIVEVKEKIQVPRKVVKETNPNPQKVKVGAPPNTVKLTWDLEPASLKERTKKAVLKLKGVNQTGNTIAMSYVEVKFSSGSEGTNMFMANLINSCPLTGWNPPVPQPKPEKTFAQKIGSFVEGKFTGKKPTSIPTKVPEPGKASDPPKASNAGTASSNPSLQNAVPTLTNPSKATAIEDDDEPVIVTPPSESAETPVTGAKTPSQVPDPEDTWEKDEAARVAAEIEKVSGTITVAVSSNVKNASPEVKLMSAYVTTGKEDKWLLKHMPVTGSQAYLIEPSGSIEFIFTMETGYANVYKMDIIEHWRNPANLSKPPPNSPSTSDVLQKLVQLTAQ